MLHKVIIQISSKNDHSRMVDAAHVAEMAPNLAILPSRIPSAR